MRNYIAVLILCIASAAQAQIKIQATGDSITYGGYGGGPSEAWRGPLYTLLANAGYNVSFVGGQVNPNDTTPANHHEGHGGWYTFTFGGYLYIVNFLQANQPDVVMWLLGINDMNLTYPEAASWEMLRDLQLSFWSGASVQHVIVSTIAHTNDPAYNGKIDQYNQAIKKLLDFAKANPSEFPGLDKVVLADCGPLIDPAVDTVDGVHPRVSGQAKYAQCFFEAWQSIYAPIGDMGTPADMTSPAPADAGCAPDNSCPNGVLVHRDDGTTECITVTGSLHIGGCSYGGGDGAGAAVGAAVLLALLLVAVRKKAVL
jgi:lysophospholipase L1-like esterase